MEGRAQAYGTNRVSRQDEVGRRGEALFFVIITKLHGRPASPFVPQFMGDKWPTVDFVVELAGHAIDVVPFFFVQVRTTRLGYTARGKRLRVSVSARDANRLACYPAPTYVIGIDEVGERAYVTAVNGKHQRGLRSLSTEHPLDRKTQDALFREVESFWQRFSGNAKSSAFEDPGWR